MEILDQKDESVQISSDQKPTKKKSLQKRTPRFMKWS